MIDAAHDCRPWQASVHAAERWAARFADCGDLHAAVGRAVLLWHDHTGHHLVDPETRAEFVARRDDRGRWLVVTVLYYREGVCKRKRGRR